MAHENATPAYPDERAPLSCRLIGPVNIGDAATIDAVEADNDALRAENERLRFARRDLAEELLAVLTQLSEADDVTDYARQERIADLRAALALEDAS